MIHLLWSLCYSLCSSRKERPLRWTRLNEISNCASLFLVVDVDLLRFTTPQLFQRISSNLRYSGELHLLFDQAQVVRAFAVWLIRFIYFLFFHDVLCFAYSSHSDNLCCIGVVLILPGTFIYFLDSRNMIGVIKGYD